MNHQDKDILQSTDDWFNPHFHLCHPYIYLFYAVFMASLQPKEVWIEEERAGV